MKDFSLNEIADEAASNFPGVSKDVVRHIAWYATQQWLQIMRERKGRIRMQKCDIHTIYFEVSPKEMRARMADLDESRELNKKEEELLILNNVQAKILPRKIKWLNRRLRRIHSPRPYTSDIYPK